MDLLPALQEYVDRLPFFDTHSHAAGFELGTPVDDHQPRSLPQLLMNDYLAYLAGACADGLPAPPHPGEWRAAEAEAHWQALTPLLDQYRGLSTWVAMREGIRVLHPFSEPDITTANWQRINEQVAAAYRLHGARAWLRHACAVASIRHQNQMVLLPYVTDHWDALPPAERQAQQQLLAPCLVLDGYLFTGFANGGPARQRSMELVGLSPRTYDEYLAFCGRVLDLFVARGGWAVKLLCAYMRPLYFAEVPDAVAAAHFAAGPEHLAPGPLRELQDNLCWHLLAMARDRDLPLLVHTGYSVPTAWGDPDQLLNLLTGKRLTGLRVDLCHAGWPHAGAALLLARTFRHCYFNLCWLHLLSPTLARQLLAQAIEMLPRNKILTGTDQGTAEGMVGAAQMGRRQLAQVLSEKVTGHEFPESVARGLARAILWANPLEFYGQHAAAAGLRADAAPDS